jgi:hypothetical protein
MDVQVHRKRRLRELIDAKYDGVIARFADKIGRSNSYVARMLYPMDKAGAKPIADRLMLAIEEAFGLERAWLDRPLGYGLHGEMRAVEKHAPKDWRLQASPRSLSVIEHLSTLAAKNALKDEDWRLIEELAYRLRKSH